MTCSVLDATGNQKPGATHVEVLGVNFIVLRKVEVLLGNKDTLCQSDKFTTFGHCIVRDFGGAEKRHTAEEVLVNLLSVCFGDEPDSM